MSDGTTRNLEQYDSVIRQVLDGDLWTLRDDSPLPAVAIERATTEPATRAELFLEHHQTTATMVMDFRIQDPKTICQLTLDMPLDTAIPEGDERFVTALARGHGRVAEIYSHDYIEPVESVTTILRASIPADYNQAELRSLLPTIEAIVLQIKLLHSAVMSPLMDDFSTSLFRNC